MTITTLATVAAMTGTIGETLATLATVTAMMTETGEIMTTLTILIVVREKLQIVRVKPVIRMEGRPMTRNLENLPPKRGALIMTQTI